MCVFINLSSIAFSFLSLWNTIFQRVLWIKCSCTEVIKNNDRGQSRDILQLLSLSHNCIGKSNNNPPKTSSESQFTQKLSLSWRDQCCHFRLSTRRFEAELQSWQSAAEAPGVINAISSDKERYKTHRAAGELPQHPQPKPLLRCGKRCERLRSSVRTGLGITMRLVPFCGMCRTQKDHAKTQVFLKIQFWKESFHCNIRTKHLETGLEHWS